MADGIHKKTEDQSSKPFNKVNFDSSMTPTESVDAIKALRKAADTFQSIWDEVSESRMEMKRLKQRIQDLEVDKANMQAKTSKLQAEKDKLQVEKDKMQAEKVKMAERHELALKSQAADHKRTLELERGAVISRNDTYGELILEYQSGDKWLRFHVEMAATVSGAYWAGKSTVEVEYASQKYIVDFDKLTQLNKDSGKTRRIRLRCVLPDHWSYSSEGALYFWGLDRKRLKSHVPLPPTPSSSWFDVASEITEDWKLQEFKFLLRESVHHHLPNPGSSPSPCDDFCAKLYVRRAWHIENIELLKEYIHRVNRIAEEPGKKDTLNKRLEPCKKLRELKDRCALPGVLAKAQERFLLHGTTYERCSEIVVDGFDPRCAGAHTTYGKGTYFTSQACKSWQYVRGEPGFIIIARVALGKPHTIEQWPGTEDQLKRPPSGHDSVLVRPGPMPGYPFGNGLQSHCEYISFEKYLAYPEFVLEVSLV